MAVKFKNKKTISVREWDELVKKTYGKPYSFQQQDGCKDRGTEYVNVPSDDDDYDNDTLPEIVNHNKMGVSFKAWLERDPTKPLDGGGKPEKADTDQWSINLWWERNFYPAVGIIANDLHKRGLLEAGEFYIDIDW